MRAVFLFVALALLVAGCTNVYESGEATEHDPVDCDPTFKEEQLDDGATSPLRCERTDNASSSGDRAAEG